MQRFIKEINWLQCLGLALMLPLFGKLFLSQSALRPWFWGGTAALLTWKYFLDWPDTRLRLQAARQQSWFHQLCQMLPPVLPAMLAMNLAIFQSLWQWITGKPRVQPPLQGMPISFNETSEYGTMLVIFFLGCVVDIPVTALMVSSVGHDAAMNLRIHLVIVLLTLYAICFVLGDRWAFKSSCHVLGQHTLHLRLADRFSADLPLSMIHSAQVMKETVRQWSVKNKLAFYDKLLVSPLDSPNVLLVLKPDAELHAISFKARRKLPRYLFLYVDHPARLLAGLPQQDCAIPQVQGDHHHPRLAGS